MKQFLNADIINRVTKVKYKSVNKLSREDSAYLGGLIDGEGTITLTRRHKGFNRYLGVTISSTERQILEWVLKTVGVGNITNKRTYSEKHAPSYTYQVFSQQALGILEQIYPYLRTYKNKRARLAMDNYDKLTPRNGRYSPELLKRREKFIEAFFEIKANV